MPVTLPEFIEQATFVGLLSTDDINAIISSPSASERPRDAEQLARLLVKQQKLTPFQAQQLYQGKGNFLVVGNYLLLDKLGEGGMAAVFKARHRKMNRIVAIKILPRSESKNPESVRRFQREAEAAARLKHPNIVTAFDADESDGVHYLVMEYIDGVDLGTLVERRGPVPVEQAVSYVVQAARGLAYAHKSGVIHRDIKPSNLVLDAQGMVRVLDMGIARIESSGEQDKLTKTGYVMGTVDFVAPEQAVDTRSADARADIYSLGVTLWYLLTGRILYDGTSLVMKLLAHQNNPIPSLREACPDVSPHLEAVFERMVAKNPADRYQSMPEVLAALLGNDVKTASAAGGGTSVAPVVDIIDGIVAVDDEEAGEHPTQESQEAESPVQDNLQSRDTASIPPTVGSSGTTTKDPIPAQTPSISTLHKTRIFAKALTSRLMPYLPEGRFSQLSLAFVVLSTIVIAGYIVWDIRNTAHVNRVRVEIVALDREANRLRSENKLRESLDRFETMLTQGNGSRDPEVRKMVQAAQQSRDELREILRDELAREAAQRRQQELEQQRAAEVAWQDFWEEFGDFAIVLAWIAVLAVIGWIVHLATIEPPTTADQSTEQRREAERRQREELRKTQEPCPMCQTWIPRELTTCSHCNAPLRDPAALQVWKLQQEVSQLRQLQSQAHLLDKEQRSAGRSRKQGCGCLLMAVSVVLMLLVPPLGALLFTIGLIVLVVGLIVE